MDNILAISLKKDFEINELIFLNELETRLGENYTLTKRKTSIVMSISRHEEMIRLSVGLNSNVEQS